MLRIVLGRGRRRLRRQAWVVAESSPTRHSHESTGTDYWLRRLHPLTRRRPGPIALEYSPAWPASHPKSTSPRTNEKRHNLVFDDTIRQDGPPGFDLVSRCCSFGRQSRSDTPFPKDSSISEPLTLNPPPPLFSTHVDRRLGALSSIKTRSLAQAQSLSYRHNLAATRNFRSSHSFNSLLLKAFDLFSTTSDSGVPRLVTLKALTERGKMDENI